MEIIFNNEQIVLSPHRAAFWPRKKILFLADMHLGKTSYFRSKGIQIPSSVMSDDLARLTFLIDKYKAESIVVAGDMFHHNYNSDINIFKQWRETKTDVRFVLVPGNHDKLLGIDYDNLGIMVTEEEYILDPFTIIHQPPKSVEQFSISGHIHPGYLMEGRARQSLRLPCFIINERQMILPAFSGFTGLYTKFQTSGPCVNYVIGRDTIFKI
ncbi:ligase-associated DNA damage response endonuclease PdeM [Niabella ginsengisoli]|uniref:Ligase-associated DNA damage response endonuclease PdeM n=1 Tax=Niabella ginsengisoli TaxID=522298 RepID=A0ABS9SLY9_9BACT|nr:ligase-associated DNA damage response endonuclease PdeM [Niabella ginsengisoli]MCH5599401.1 ligase-associated DNA damage response endonuclease PdeM [Niabella ginsengisoli]